MAIRVAANPIPYWLTGTVSNKSKENLEVAFKDLSQIGFSAVKADVPEGMSVQEYRDWVASYNLAPAVSLYNSQFDRSTPIAEDVEAAKQFAAQQLSLGLTATMLCPIFVPERLKSPSIGAEFDEGRFQNVLEDIATVAQAINSEGVYPLLHGHVGGWVETEEEIRRVLDTLGADVIGYGPDTGHQTWAGADPAALIRDYADRVGAIHIKDVFPDHLGTNRNPKLSYAETAGTKRLWAEPGKGVVDFAAIIAAMPADYAGDYMIEVDVPSIDSRYESLRESYDWAKEALRFAQL
jgi:inosose dehydratase